VVSQASFVIRKKLLKTHKNIVRAYLTSFWKNKIFIHGALSTASYRQSAIDKLQLNRTLSYFAVLQSVVATHSGRGCSGGSP
jgi:hypothetical protein